MILGFERWAETANKELVDEIENILRACPKKITNRSIRKNLKLTNNQEASEIKVRAAVHFLRVSGRLPNLVCDQDGYWLASDKEELRRYVKSLEQRIASINAIRLAILETLEAMP